MLTLRSVRPPCCGRGGRMRVAKLKRGDGGGLGSEVVLVRKAV